MIDTEYSTLSDEKLIERIYSARANLRCLRAMKGKVGRDARLVLWRCKEEAPLLDAELNRRGLTLPRWAQDSVFDKNLI